MISGTKVVLRAIEPSDLETLRMWRNIPEFKKHFREYREISRQMQINWYEQLAEDKNTIMFAVCNKEDGQLLGCCGLCYINWVYRHADLSLYIGFEEVYIDQCAYAEEACQLLFDYGFHELNLNKIWSELYEFDTPKIDLYTSMGFQKDGYLREQYYYDGQWWGAYILSLLHKDYNRIIERNEENLNVEKQ